ncbi:hypothetical protein SDC9_206633 [bioreactor metagenome]|uniref:Uncharacterized protein n=1 Tax=bioreactor metagenome TaxID=1076179 RepID=A0A645J699_9ZZZZ
MGFFILFIHVLCRHVNSDCRIPKHYFLWYGLDEGQQKKGGFHQSCGNYSSFPALRFGL